MADDDAPRRAPLPLNPLGPPSSGKGFARAAIQTVFAKAPVLGILSTYATNVEAARRAERTELWAQYVREGVGEEDFADQLAVALGGPEANLVREVVFASVRASVDAIDDAAVPCIARLTAHRLRTNSPDRWTFPSMLELLRGLDAEMVGCLRDVARIFSGVEFERLLGGGGAVGTYFHQDETSSFIWRVQLTMQGHVRLVDHRELELGRGDVAHRVATALNGSSRALFTGGAGVAPPNFTQDLVRFLRIALGD